MIAGQPVEREASDLVLDSRRERRTWLTLRSHLLQAPLRLHKSSPTWHPKRVTAARHTRHQAPSAGPLCEKYKNILRRKWAQSIVLHNPNRSPVSGSRQQLHPKVPPNNLTRPTALPVRRK